MKDKFVYVVTAALLSGGMVFAQSGVFEGASDSYSAGFAACQRTSGHPDKHGTPEVVRKSEAVRGWKPASPAPAKAQTVPATTRPGAMAANEGSGPQDRETATEGSGTAK